MMWCDKRRWGREREEEEEEGSHSFITHSKATTYTVLYFVDSPLPPPPFPYLRTGWMEWENLRARAYPSLALPLGCTCLSNVFFLSSVFPDYLRGHGTKLIRRRYEV